MFVWLRHFIGCVVSALGSRGDLILENLALRQQLLALHQSGPAIDHPPCTGFSGFFSDGSGRDGERLLLWSRHELWWSGIGLVFACIGDGSPEPGKSSAESR